MSQSLRITGAKVYDPTNHIDGQVRDLLIRDGVIVDALPEGASVRTIDARGLVAMPGGVDIHCHIASSTINRARAMQGEEHATHVHVATKNNDINLRSGSGVLTPSTFTTGYRYAALGYTTAVEAAVSPTGAKHTHLELDDTPNLDAGFLLLVANHEHVIELLERGEEQAAGRFIGELLRRTGALGIKVVNPGGVASWRRDPTQHIVEHIDESIASSDVSPRAILELCATVAESLKLPHPPHIHCNRLGIPGNASTTLETMRALDGRRAHLTHLQFHAYGQTNKGDFTSDASSLIQYLNEHPHLTADVGQVMFGDAFTITADTPLEYTLWQLTGKRYVSIESEMETGCGLMPIEYNNTRYLHSLQWAIGLELMLCATDPWRMMLSTDHPNGASFLSYPAIIAQLMNKSLRDEQLAKAHPRVMEQTGLADLSREMTLSEIAIISRAGPARTLGLTHKGHLGASADADITLYHDRCEDPQSMFESPRYVIKAGQVIVEDGELRQPLQGARFRAAIAEDEHGSRELGKWFDRRGSYDVSQFGLRESERSAMREIKTDGHAGLPTST